MDLRESDEEEVRENYTTRNFMILTSNPTYMRLEGHVASMGQKRNMYRVQV